MKVLKTRNERKVRKSGIKPLKYFFFFGQKVRYNRGNPTRKLSQEIAS